MPEQSMIETMKKLSEDALDDLEKKKRIDWIKEMHWPGQLIQIIDQVILTQGIDSGIFTMSNSASTSASCMRILPSDLPYPFFHLMKKILLS